MTDQIILQNEVIKMHVTLNLVLYNRVILTN